MENGKCRRQNFDICRLTFAIVARKRSAMLTRLLFVSMIVSVSHAADLQQQVEAIAQQHHGQVALYAKNLKTGGEIAIRADEPVQTASVIKVAILVEVFAEAK